MNKYFTFNILIILLTALNAVAAERTVDLMINYKTVNFADKSVEAIAVNDQIPGPTLHFQEGDHVTLNVYNHLNKPTTLHWHGIILPWQMDGVAGITQKGIKPGECFSYQFTLLQSGTYWYHAHAGLQEQQGVYGAFLIDPLKTPHYQYNKDYVVVLSDWSNTNPDQILANLKKEGDYYSPLFPLQPSLMHFLCDYQKADQAERKKLIADYKMMQQMRMSIYDFNDVAYDAFLLNGHTTQCPWTALVNMGDIVRLRFIGAGGNSIFRVKMPNTCMQVIHVQGNDVVPYTVDQFTLAPGETLDVLVKIKGQAQMIYAESTDQVASVYGALVSDPQQGINATISPFPEALPVTREMMNYGMMHHGSHSTMDHNDMDHRAMGHAMHSTKQGKKPASQISKTKYKPLKAVHATNDPNKPIYKTIKMDLDGWMDRYIWFINGVPEHQAHPIVLEPNKRYQLHFKNLSMMHHPMHIHGHWFIVRNGHGAYDPLLHTIDMPPGATIIADLDTDASGQWLFHCHLLYHMMSGMSRVFQYSTLFEVVNGQAAPQDIYHTTSYENRPIVKVDEVRRIEPSLIQHPMAHPKSINFSTHLDIGADPFNTVQRLTYKGLYGFDYHKLELFINDMEMEKGRVENADLDIFYWRLIDQFWSVKGGLNYNYRPAKTPYFQPGIGLEGLLPYFIETDIRCYLRSGSVKLDLDFDRETQITNNFFIKAGIRGIIATNTVVDDEIGTGLNQMRYTVGPLYRLAPGVSLFMEYEHEHDFGELKRIRQANDESTINNTLTLGVSLLF